MIEHAGNTALHRVYGWRGGIAWIDAAKHHDPVATRLEHFWIELTAAKFYRESTYSRLHQFRQDARVFVLMLGRPAEAWIAVAEMHQGRHRDALQATVEGIGAVVAQLVVVARHRGFIDLDHVAAGGLYFQQLLIEGDSDVESQLRFIAIDFIQSAVDHGHRTGNLHLQRAVGVSLCETRVFDR